MVDSVNPNNSSGAGSTQSSSASSGNNKAGGGGWNPQPLTWLGMKFDLDQTKKLWNIISQTVANEISKDQAKAVKAIKKMGNPDDSDDDS